MKLICVFLTILFIPLYVSSQNFSRNYGLITKSEIDLQESPGDKDAEAIVLFDVGKSYFAKTDNSFELIFEKKERIKIFNESGFKWANIEIPFYVEKGNREQVYDIEAIVYNFEDGKLSKTVFDRKNLYEEKINEFWSVKKLALPNIKAGSIIEYKYKIKSQIFFNLRDWEFQKRIPVVYSKYQVEMIPFYEYTWLLQGANKFSSYLTSIGGTRTFGQINFNDKIHKYIMKDLPSFKEEEFISNINDYIIKIDFQLAKLNFANGGSREIFTTWPDLIKKLNKHEDFGKFANKSEKLAEKLIHTKEIEDKPSYEKFNIIVDYVKRNYNWNGYINEFASKSPNQLVKDKFGNCADLNLLAIGLLRVTGIEAYPVILSTRTHGKIKFDYPFSHFFNYVIIQANVDGKLILTDATSMLISNERLPIRCINDKGLIIKKGEVKWVSLQCNFPSKTDRYFLIDSIASKARVNVNLKATEYDAYNFTNIFGEDIKKIKESLEQKNYVVDDSSISIDIQKELNRSFNLSYTTAANVEQINNKIYLSPFLNELVDENPLKQRARNYPIDMIYPSLKSFTSIINIPKGYKVDFVGENYNINNEFFELHYNTNNSNDKLQVSFSYFFKKPIYSSKEYLKIKFYYNEIVKRGNEKVVLSSRSTSSSN